MLISSNDFKWFNSSFCWPKKFANIAICSLCVKLVRFCDKQHRGICYSNQSYTAGLASNCIKEQCFTQVVRLISLGNFVLLQILERVPELAFIRLSCFVPSDVNKECEKLCEEKVNEFKGQGKALCFVGVGEWI